MDVPAALDEPLARELLEAPLVASLGTRNPDGSIHVIPVWFLRDGGRILVATSRTSRKARNVEREARATLMVHDSPGGLDVRGLTVYGQARIVRGEEARRLNERVHRKYVTARGLAIPSVAEFLEGDDATIVLSPQRAVPFDETASAAARELAASGEYVQTRGIR